MNSYEEKEYNDDNDDDTNNDNNNNDHENDYYLDNENENDHYDNYYNNHNIQVDYSRNDVTLEIFFKVLLGGHEPHALLIIQKNL